MVSEQVAIDTTKQINGALNTAGALLSQVRDGKYYEAMGYKSFSSYVIHELQIHRSTVYRLLKQVEMNAKLSQVRDSLSQRGAAELNKVPEDIRVAVGNIVVNRADGSEVAASEIKVVAEVLTEAQRTGHVSIDGDQLAFDAAITNGLFEAIKRQRRYVAESQRKWEMVRTEELTVETTAYELPPELVGKHVKVTIKELVQDEKA